MTVALGCWPMAGATGWVTAMNEMIDMPVPDGSVVKLKGRLVAKDFPSLQSPGQIEESITDGLGNVGPTVTPSVNPPNSKPCVTSDTGFGLRAGYTITWPVPRKSTGAFGFGVEMALSKVIVVARAGRAATKTASARTATVSRLYTLVNVVAST